MLPLTALRAKLEEAGIHAYFLPNSDPHQSEYPAPHWRLMPWLTGFTGSAGNVLFTQDFAGVWTDSRYFLQADAELNPMGFELMKLMVPHTPEFLNWMKENLPVGSTLALDGSLVSLSRIRSFEKHLSAKNIQIQDVGDWVSDCWPERPELPMAPLKDHPVKFAGKSREDKLMALREQMKATGATHHLLTSLDEWAWLLNVRGSDVAYNPVAVGYVLVSEETATLFIQPEKVSPQLAKILEEAGVSIDPYEAVGEALAALPKEAVLRFDPARISWQLSQQISGDCQPQEGEHFTTLSKAQKNEVEQQHIRSVMVKDGIAMVRFLRWLEKRVPAGGLTEHEVGKQIHRFRFEQERYVGHSFSPIVGYRGNGAIVHYSAKEGDCAELQPGGMLLVDSGGQYEDGTTDITRTIALGSPTEAERRDFTLVLKGHIALAMAAFPEGTAGYQLEAFARMPLWQHGMTYGHGTGHGVGFYLNVHEGPQSFGRAASGKSAVALAPGMLTSNEPGLYHEGKYGIRIENLMLCVPYTENEAYGKFLALETVTLCPIDQQLIDPAMLTFEEKEWLNQYHQLVLLRLSPFLLAEEQAWLQQQCSPIR
ncbi:MAG: aminopeptidase P family protein [Bacteroidota bacterium]